MGKFDRSFMRYLLQIGDRLKYLTMLVKAECTQLFLEVGRSFEAGVAMT
jgi:hypothetical protein